MPELHTQKIDIKELQEGPDADALNERLTQLCVACFEIEKENYDLNKYTSATFYLLRDFSLTQDKNDPRNIVGFNMVAHNMIPGEGNRLAVKFGPSAVETAYRRHAFVLQTTVSFIMPLLKRIAAENLQVVGVIVATNPRFQALFPTLPDQLPTANINAQLQAAASAIYPPPVLAHIHEFVQGGHMATRWRVRKDNAPDYGMAYLVPITLENLLSAQAKLLEHTKENTSSSAAQQPRSTSTRLSHANQTWARVGTPTGNPDEAPRARL